MTDPAIEALSARLLDDEVFAACDSLSSPVVQRLLEFPSRTHPYKKWGGAHWRLVSLADLEVETTAERLRDAVDLELGWLTAPEWRRRIRTIDGLVRRCASQEGNAVYACARLEFASDERVPFLVRSLLEWQWPDGGWNCDVNASGRRSSFHETVTPALGLAAWWKVTGDEDAFAGARRAGELFLEHRLFRSLRTGDVIHPQFTKLHYPAYWHYDVLQALRLLDALDLIEDERASEAVEVLRRSRRRDGRFSGPSWSSKTQRPAVDWGTAAVNDMLNVLAQRAWRRLAPSVA